MQHLDSVSRDYPGVWKRYAKIFSVRRSIGDWPSWCFCPVAAALSIVSGGTNRIPPSRSLDVARVAALAAWRPTQGIYRFDPTLLSELLDTPVAGDLPAEHLQRLPEWCVYVELDLDDTLGFFAHLEYDLNNQQSELMLLLDCRDRVVPLAIQLKGTLEQALSTFVAHANKELVTVALEGGAISMAAIAQKVAPLVSVLLYLCTGETEMRPTRDPKRTHDPAVPKRNRDGELYLPPARRPEVWETGFRLGAALRDAARSASEVSGGGPRGHIRRAHWHSYWKGSATERELEIRWLPPIAVNLEVPDRPTIRNVNFRPELSGKAASRLHRQ
jgi:hypothetical protein